MLSIREGPVDSKTSGSTTRAIAEESVPVQHDSERELAAPSDTAPRVTEDWTEVIAQVKELLRTIEERLVQMDEGECLVRIAPSE